MEFLNEMNKSTTTNPTSHPDNFGCDFYCTCAPYHVNGHNAVDFWPKPSGFEEEPIYAAINGRVQVWESTRGGKSLSITSMCGNIVVTYLHLEEIHIENNQLIIAGFEIGIMGNTGTDSTGIHLHFTVRENGILVDPINFFKRRI
ncbi:MAG: M23 family metallopeptidase [Oscillospiraceae bacterium]|jgi:murein DD-endopeptidase MepM/ murein hydrolase activator NlpD|nr:M23 family metallopeptidase [Oscillospiraceae bacterium]